MTKEDQALLRNKMSNPEIQRACHTIGFDIYDINTKLIGRNRSFKTYRNFWSGQDRWMDWLVGQGYAAVIYETERNKSYCLTAKGFWWLQKNLAFTGFEILVRAEDLGDL